MSAAPLPWQLLLHNTFWAAVAALCFAVLFNVPRRALLGCALGGAIAYAARTWVAGGTPLGVELATLIAALIVGFLSVPFGRLLHMPALIFVVPGVIPLVPGALAFRTMLDILELATGDPAASETLLVETVIASTQTLLIVGAMAAGVAVPSLLLRRHRPLT